MVHIDLATSLEDCVRDVIEIDLLRPHWMHRAACRGQGFDAWFSTDEMEEEADAARRVCAGCPVRSECLDYALDGPIRHGLWGGLSPEERAALNRRREPHPAAKSRQRYYAYGR
jgi:WhiB family transcriptional regulator, redox-sensing transcriptional regulator